MKERNQSLDAGKGLAILLVMLGHCIVLNGLQDGYLYDAIHAVQMPLFMMISGYITALSAPAKDGRQLWQRIGKRAVCYLVPFFVWIVLLHPTHILKSIHEILFCLDKGLWFLMVLFLLTTVMYLAVYLYTHKAGALGFLAVWAVFGAILLGQSQMGNSFLSPHLSLYQAPFYVGGFLLCQGRKYGNLCVQKKTLLALMGAGTPIFVYLAAAFDLITADNKAELLIQVLASTIGCLLCLGFAVVLKAGRVKRALSLIGTYTLEIYVLHFHFATILRLSQKNLTLWSIQGMIWVLAAFALMSAATALLIFLLKQFRLTDFLLFGKSKEIH